FVLTDTVKKGNVQFSLLGTNVKRTQLPESDRYGQWNRLTNYLTINTTTMTPSVGTITELGNGKYHFEVNLLDVALNGGSGEVADGTETLRLMYFSTVNRSFNISNIGYIL
ncbi:MAG: hypothetical protein MJ193_05060, partial [Clostridia bacterium]|nr:hypothetical protein [Clostridia bacterium]